MDCKVLLFGISREIAGTSELTMQINDGDTVEDLKTNLVSIYPEFSELTSLLIAINNEYATPDQRLNKGDEIAVIPPVSGG